MTSVDPTNQLASIIREQITRRKGGRVAKLGKSVPQGGARTPTNQDAINVFTSRRIQAIDPFDVDRNRKAFRVFLESALLSEFGMDLVNDPEFYRLVDDVQRSMEAVDHLRPLIDQAGKLLLQQKLGQK